MTGPDGVTFFPVLGGLAHGESVVASGSFLVDAETRLNPAAGSIYFGGSSGSKGTTSGASTVRPTTPEDPDAELIANLRTLSPDDRQLAEAQRFCPILADSRLGAMGPPFKMLIEGQPVFLCCSGCQAQAMADPQGTLATVEKLKRTYAPAASPAADAAKTHDSLEVNPNSSPR